jgi:hypothetical protein
MLLRLLNRALGLAGWQVVRVADLEAARVQLEVAERLNAAYLARIAFLEGQELRAKHYGRR